MAAGKLHFEAPSNGTWRKTVRYSRPAGTRQEPNRRIAIDLTGFHAKLQARRKLGEPVLFTISSDPADSPEALIPALGSDGVISWALPPTGLVGLVLYDLLLYDPDGLPDPLLEGQIEFQVGVTEP